MRITAQEEYGLRCILQIARRASKDPVSIQDIATAEGLSKQYVAKLLHQLQKADLLASSRGIHGGYRLTHPAEEISVGQVIEAMGGLFTSRAHKTKNICETFVGNRSSCVHNCNCGVRPLWTIITRQVALVLQRLTIANLLAEESVSTALIEGYFNQESHHDHTTLPHRQPARAGRGETDSEGRVAHHQSR